MPIFDQFVSQFVIECGAEPIPVSSVGGEKRADFIFRRPNVIAELKTLDKDARMEHASKVQALVSQWVHDRRIFLYGKVPLSLRTLRSDLQREWLTVLERPIERVIRKAQRQIRQTRRALGIPNAKGLAIVANESNLLYTTASDYLAVASHVLKKTLNGQPCFPSIDGILYISPTEWRFGSVRADPDLEGLLVKLRKAWPNFVLSRIHGKHGSPAENQ